MEQVKNEINFLRETSIDTIDPEIKKTEDFIDKINKLHEQIDVVNNELDQQVGKKKTFFNLISFSLLKLKTKWKQNPEAWFILINFLCTIKIKKK